jgi:hypothetical protein
MSMARSKIYLNCIYTQNDDENPNLKQDENETAVM